MYHSADLTSDISSKVLNYGSSDHLPINLYPNQVEEDTPALFQAAFKFSILKVIIVLSFT